jgi:hypothetical protein
MNSVNICKLFQLKLYDIQKQIVCLIVLLLLLFSNSMTQTQVSFSQHTIDTDLDGASFVKVEDMDGDGDKDVVAAARGAGQIVWYEYLTWNKDTIVSNWTEPYISVANMDGDDDYDVVASSFAINRISWFENPDWNENVINGNAPGAVGVCAADINKDDTMDVVVAHGYNNEIVWYEGPHWGIHLIGSNVITPSPPNYPDNVFVHDIDGDQDLDVLITIWNVNFTIGSLILYTNNDPDTTWTKTVVDPDIGYILSLDVADMDFDDTLDVVATSVGHDMVLWYDLPSWTRGDTIDPDFNATGMGIGDIDKDDIVDVVAAGQDTTPPGVRWYKGPGWQMNAVYPQDVGFHSLIVTDLDDDTDMDIITTLVQWDQVWWFENLLIPTTGILNDKHTNIPSDFSLKQNYPNPFNPSTIIEFDLPKSSEVTLKVYNILGERVATLVSERLTSGSYSYKWSQPAGIASGVYLYRLEAEGFVETRKMIIVR